MNTEIKNVSTLPYELNTLAYTADGLQKIRDVKKTILKKKVMMNFIIDNHSLWDRVYKLVAVLVTAATPVVLLVANVTGTGVNIAALVLSMMSAFLNGIENYVTYGKLRDIAKSQNIKYTLLFDKIEREMIKPNNKRTTEDDLLYWISRELTNIEILDPELKYDDKQKFHKLCKDKGIPYDEDLNELEKMIAEDNKNAPLTQIVVANPLPIADTRARALSDDRDLDLLKKGIKNPLKPADDIKWAMDRLNNL
jgi:hypothetical protein